MKLELQNIVGYLPYGLKYKDKPEGFNEIRTLCINTIGWFLYEGKPILRPLSDLTKEIEVNGEKFVPIVKLQLKYDWSDKISINDFSITSMSMEDVLFVIEKLYEWNFDIHGLIEAGLAIDINTLKP